MATSIDRRIARLTTAIERERHFLRLPDIGNRASPQSKSEACESNAGSEGGEQACREPVERKISRLRVGESGGGSSVMLKKDKMSWRVIYEKAGVRKLSQPLRTRTEAMIFACDLGRDAVFVNAIHSTGQSISKLELETWRRANDAMLKGRVSPRCSTPD